MVLFLLTFTSTAENATECQPLPEDKRVAPMAYSDLPSTQYQKSPVSTGHPLVLHPAVNANPLKCIILAFNAAALVAVEAAPISRELIERLKGRASSRFANLVSRWSFVERRDKTSPNYFLFVLWCDVIFHKSCFSG